MHGNTTIWHNPRCSKSRQALALLEEKGVKIDVRNYLEVPLTDEELEYALDRVEPQSLIRIKEEELAPYRTGIAAMDKAQIKALLLQFPRTLERPVVFHNGKGIVARPPEKVNALF